MSRKADIQVNIRLTREEAERIRLAAERNRKTVSGLIRSAAMKLAAIPSNGRGTGATSA